MYRIGMVGTDSSHADHFVRALNVEHRFPARLTALTGGATARLRELAIGGAEIATDLAELVANVDAVIVGSRDARLHRALAEPALRAGLPVFVDKPLTASLSDAQALVDLALAHGAPLTSLSALRFAAGVRDVVTADVGEPRVLVVRGPASPASEYAGLAFLGSHVVEIAHEVLGRPRLSRPIVPDAVTQDGDTVLAFLRTGDVRCVLAFVPPGRHPTPFHVSLTATRGTVTRGIELPQDYLLPVLDAVVTMLRTGRAPLDPEALLHPVAVLEAVDHRLPPPPPPRR